MGLLAARLVLAAVFAVAGVAKLADREGTRRALRGFGVRGRATIALAIVLPVVELGVAVALLPAATAWWAALAGLTLLGVFAGAIAVNLARGRTPECHCFGQIHSAPAGWPALVRNGALAAVAAFVLWRGAIDPGTSAVGWLAELTRAEAAALAGALLVLGLLAAQGWLLLGILRQNGRLLLRIQAVEARLGVGLDAADDKPVPAPERSGLPIGAPAPAFALATLDQRTVTLDDLSATGRPMVLVFSDPSCGPCATLLPKLSRWQEHYADTLTIVVISTGTGAANRSKLAGQPITPVLLQHDREVAEAYKVAGTPTAVVVSGNGKIASALARGAEEVESLVAHAARHPAPLVASDTSGAGGRVAPPIGTPACAVAFTRLDGGPVELAAFRGRPTLLLFWDPSCRFCQDMLDDLKAWENDPPPAAPRLLVVATGTAEANRAMGLRASIVLDQGLATAGATFGATGTPMAIRLDADGRIASPLAVGADEVLSLASASPHGSLTVVHAHAGRSLG